LGLLVHAASDGAAIGMTHSAELAHATHHHSHTFAHAGGHGLFVNLAVVMHQVPIGLLLWVSVGARFGPLAALAAIVLMSSATLLGYFGIVAPLDAMGPAGAGLLLAFVGGSLLHVVIGHEHEHAHEHGGETGGTPEADEEHDTPYAHGVAPYWSGLGALCAVVMVGIASHVAGGLEEAPALRTFTILFTESAPALWIGFTLAGLAHTYLPYARLGWLARGGALSQAARGVVVGLPLPICSCGVVPLFHSLVRRGVPPAAAIAFLIATPEIGVDALLISIPLLGIEISIARLVVALLVALLAGAVVGPLVARRLPPPAATDEPIETPPPHRRRLALALRHGLVTSVDEIMPWLLVGLVVAALAAPLLDAQWIEALPRGLDVLLCALLGLPIYVCATGATPIVAVLVAKGVSPGAAIAFLLTGPATNVTTFGVVSRLWGRRPALWLAGVSIGATVVLGWAINLVLTGSEGAALALAHGTEGSHPFERLAALALGLLFLVRVLLRGPRPLLREVSLRPHAPALEEEGCGGCCDTPRPSDEPQHQHVAAPASAGGDPCDGCQHGVD
ncbi:MAG: hypothetical protein D6776_06275, partial [Planctomycetota bacterium]